jgi:hypothetical protein
MVLLVGEPESVVAQTSTASGFGLRVTLIVHPIVLPLFFPVSLAVEAIGLALALALGVGHDSHHFLSLTIVPKRF